MHKCGVTGLDLILFLYLRAFILFCLCQYFVCEFVFCDTRTEGKCIINTQMFFYIKVGCLIFFRDVSASIRPKTSKTVSVLN